MSYGISTTRGAAAGMSFCFSLLLVTMLRNTITFLRGTFLNLYAPFDSIVSFHKVVAWTALFFTGTGRYHLTLTLLHINRKLSFHISSTSHEPEAPMPNVPEVILSHHHYFTCPDVIISILYYSYNPWLCSNIT
ncbi:hypothetical protein DPMN_076164 [Dreissena polymorpha]|uniref:Uncharacterized protein n=1 Tax=Dreissena polymorpha TaxID=45954 RepID=A0A9D3YJL4_DREPO|nr:hypothetical protein DPMN_076164 [Dreissena polymorpha]